MATLIDLTEVAVLTGVRAMLLAVLPSGIEVIRAQSNRVPEPLGPDFVVMTPLRRTRLSTNIDNDADIQIAGGIAFSEMTVSAVANGTLSPGQELTGPGVVIGSIIIEQLSGTPGLDGIYTIAPSQNVATGTIYAGLHGMMQPTNFTYQLDIHGPSSAENAQIISTIGRDWWACQFLAPYGIQPLYADDPRQLAFVNAENQYEDRFIVEMCLQGNPTVSVLQQYADQVNVDLINAAQ
jgi:hypothetical protein